MKLSKENIGALDPKNNVSNPEKFDNESIPPNTYYLNDLKARST